jgi:transcriptional regulator GlxA family with amidase domain
MKELVEMMVNESKQQLAGHSLAVQGLGQLALVELWRSHGVSASVPAAGALHLAEHGELSGALQLVKTRFYEPLDVEQLAKACHLSTKHFGRKFRHVLGLTPMEYLRQVRLNQARGALASGEAPVGTIARQCGFEDSAHFSRAFKAHWGASPLEFRRTLRQTMRTS